MSGIELYSARVIHRRHVSPLYRFVYRIFYMLFDIDQLGESARRYRFFSYNRFNLLSFHDRDHEAEPGQLRAWVNRTVAAHGINCRGGRVRVLCMPRVLGFVFNPISIYYCENAAGALCAMLVEVRNTFGERHCYLLDAAGQPMPYEAPLETDKVFHVSPFFAVEGRYRFRFTQPGDRVRVAIREFVDESPVLDAVLAGERIAVSDRALLRQVLRMPWATLKVVAGIHWEAFKLWRRGARFHRKPEPPLQEIS
jgi:DUF1365 family protein